MAKAEIVDRAASAQAKQEEVSGIATDFLSNCPAGHWANDFHVNTRGEKMDFENMNYLLSLYMLIDLAPRMVVEKSVQCGLSELFIIKK